MATMYYECAHCDYKGTFHYAGKRLTNDEWRVEWKKVKKEHWPNCPKNNKWESP